MQAQVGLLPLHLALKYQASEAVVRALLGAYPQAAKVKDKVRFLHFTRPSLAMMIALGLVSPSSGVLCTG